MNFKKYTVLLAEDEEALGNIIKESLETRGFEVIYCQNGDEAKNKFIAYKPQLLVLDVMMPKKDGFSLVKEIRQIDQTVPIIFLTAKSRTEDVVEGFSLGANDFLKKPFSLEELIVRIKSLLGSRIVTKSTSQIPIGTYIFDTEKQTLTSGAKTQLLTHRESQLLEALIKNKNSLTDRDVILEMLWGRSDFFNARSMDVFITKLRKKLSKDPNIKILNVRGFGYKLIC